MTQGSDICGRLFKCGMRFELLKAVFDGAAHQPLIDCQPTWRIPQFFEAAIGSKKEPSSLGLTGGAAPPPYASLKAARNEHLAAFFLC